MEPQKKKTIIVTGAVILAALVVVGALLWLYFAFRKPQEGDKNITVQLVYDDQNIELELNTDAGYLLDALKELQEQGKMTFVLDPNQSSPFIMTINDRTADWNKKEWFCIYVKAPGTTEFVYATGADDQTIKDGEIYKIELSISDWE